jgi:hypothetical protein
VPAPLVTFLVPCFNYAHFLAECVESILKQTHSNLEVLILDDASKDDTPQVAARFTDPRVRYIRHEKNLGLSRNFNAGLEQARGEFLWLISADDCLANETSLERALAAFSSDREISMVWSAPLPIGDVGHWVSSLYQEPSPREWAVSNLALDLAKANFVCAPCVLARTESYKHIGGYPVEAPYLADWYCWFRISLLGKARYLPDPLACYRVHQTNWTGSITSTGNVKLAVETLRMHLAMIELTTDLPAFEKPVMQALDADLRELLLLWLGHTSDREVLTTLLASGLRITSVPRSRVDIRQLVSGKLQRAKSALLAESIRQLRPRFLLRQLIERRSLERLDAALEQGTVSS